jgi:hypothetical protein
MVLCQFYACSCVLWELFQTTDTGRTNCFVSGSRRGKEAVLVRATICMRTRIHETYKVLPDVTCLTAAESEVLPGHCKLLR